MSLHPVRPRFNIEIVLCGQYIAADKKNQTPDMFRHMVFATTYSHNGVPQGHSRACSVVSTPSERLFVTLHSTRSPLFDEWQVLIMSKLKDLARDTVAHIIGLKDAGHTIKEICELTGAGPTSVKKFVL
ncbi:hypothetical protein E2C01_045729 [Portunus trituberculatus]|uniref:Uncharacterized protein n=1 Tax=Portunus trituberculatus TaxID=210409 RepID=A0A5B7G3S3_PORTR|nr:hypothetical protein [Portunus trituberculatus]